MYSISALIRWQHLTLIVVACPILYLIPSAHYLSWPMLGLIALSEFRKRGTDPSDTEVSADASVWNVAIIPWFFIPFLGSQMFFPLPESIAPPAHLPSRAIPGGYEIRFPGKEDSLAIIWYDPNGTDRHHQLKTCLGYRGIELTEAPIKGIHSDGDYWFKEFYLVEGNLLESHLVYLRYTLGLRRDPGVHLITVAPKSRRSASEFDKETRKAVAALLSEVTSVSS